MPAAHQINQYQCHYWCVANTSAYCPSNHHIYKRSNFKILARFFVQGYFVPETPIKNSSRPRPARSTFITEDLPLKCNRIQSWSITNLLKSQITNLSSIILQNFLQSADFRNKKKIIHRMNRSMNYNLFKEKIFCQL